MNPTAVETIRIAETSVHNGEQIAIDAIRHDMIWPGTESDTTFSVSVFRYHMGAFMAVAAYGFFSERDAFRFACQSNELQYDLFMPDGTPFTDVRKGLGISYGSFRRHVLEI